MTVPALPEPGDPPESIRHRDAPDAGLTRQMLRSSSWCHPADGTALATERRHDLAARCRAVQRVLPAHAVWTHATAAVLRGWWLPVGMVDLPLIVSTDGEAPHHDRRGVFVRRVAVPPGHRTEIDEVRVASAAWTIAELAEDLGLIDLVVVIDCAVGRGDCTLDEIRSVCVRGRRGVRTLRQAIELADPRSESPWETILRVLHVLGGVTHIEPQAILLDRRGRFVARGDLRIGKTRRIHEYDGGVHRDREQHERDLDRDKRLSRADWDRRGYTSVEIVDDPAQILRDAAHALGRRFDDADLAVWRFEAARSSITPEGRARLRRRLRRFDRRSTPRPSGRRRPA